MDDAGPAELAPTLPPGLPDDWVFDRDLPCPTCRYNLRMLHTPRCPECGTVFRWQGLLHIGCPRCGNSLEAVDADACPACGLALNWQRLLAEADPGRLRQFEYARRPIRAALRTWAAALLPRRFWKSIRIESPPAVIRLRWLRRTALAIGLLAILLAHTLEPRTPWPQARSPLDCLGLVAVVLSLPVVTMLALPRFTPTLMRFRVRRDQLVRCTAYAASGLVWIGMILMLAVAAEKLVNAVWPLQFRWATALRLHLQPDSVCFWLLVYPCSDMDVWFNRVVGTLVLMLAFVWWWRFLYVGLRHYLRLDRRNTAALLLSTQLIGLLIALVILVAWATSTPNGLRVLQRLHWKVGF
ncbi:MAG: YIP1 family protein [Phycisphaerae bacterium]